MRVSVILIGIAVATLGYGFPLAGQATRPAKPAAPMAGSIVDSTPLHRLVSLDLRDVTLGDALKEIDRQAGLGLSYTPRVVPVTRRISLRLRRVTAAAALERVLDGTDVRVVVTPDSAITLVKEKSGTSPLSGGSTITGQVIDSATARAIKGAEVFLEGTPRRTETDTTGHYRLPEVAAGTYALTVRRLGYIKKSRQITVQEGQDQTVDVTLVPTAVKLNELVTTATGQQRRRDIGNSITTIHADSVLQTAAIRNLTDLLENRVPGLTAQRFSGAPGDPARLRLRGLGSVLRSNDPVVVVDGVRIYSVQSAARSGNLTNLGGRGAIGPVTDASGRPLTTGDTPAPSPLDQIDPNTIEKIEVFKGPSAATMYGADAANGVIVITTKRGKPGPTRWNASVWLGRTDSPGRFPNGYYRFGHIPVLGNFTIFCPLVEIRCVQDSLVRYQALNDPDLTPIGTGQRTALSLTASGGTQAVTYSLTGSYDDEVGLLTLPALEAERFQTRFNRDAPDWMQRPHRLKDWNVTSKVTARLGQTADVTLATSLGRTQQQRSTLERQLASLAGTYVDKVNGLYYTSGTSGSSGFDLTHTLQNEDTYLREYFKRTTASSINVTTSINSNWRPTSWFTAAGQAGLNVIPRDDELFLPAGLVASTDSGGLVRGTGRSLQSTFNLQGTARKPLRLGFMFETSFGANLVTLNTSDLVSTAVGLVPGTSSLTGASFVTATEQRSSTSVFGWFVEPRITGQRFSLSTGIRLDGGSSYGARVQGLGSLLSLPKLNGSWVVSEEPWFPFKSLVSSLRLRGSYGQAQVQPGPTDRLRLYTPALDAGGKVLDLTTIGNSRLRPERSTEVDGGFDADLLDSRVSVELTRYRKMQVDALMPTQLPGSINGGGRVLTNIGNVRNTGWEIVTRLTPVQSHSLTWSMELNYARNDNMLIKLGQGVAPNPRQGLVAGYPVGSRWALPILGYADANGNGVLERSEVQVGDSLVYLGRLMPAYTTSLYTNVALFGGTVGITAGLSYDAGAMQIDQTLRSNWVLARPLVDASTPPIEQAAVLVYDTTDYGLTQDVSTFRFTSLSVNYRAPARVAHLLRAEGLTIGLQGTNLGLHTTYRGKDPNVAAWSSGEDVVDTGQLPVPRTWQLSFSLKY